MFKFVIYAALATTFLVAVSCKEAENNSKSDSCGEDGYGKSKKCLKHEVCSTCIQAECRPLNCSQVGESIPCPRIDPDYCEEGCVCEVGYVRDKKGKCIQQDKCPSSGGCGGDPNAVKKECGTYCGHSCSDYNKTGVICPDICVLDACACKTNYVYDPQVEKCVLPKDCTTSGGCGGDPNAVTSDCGTYCGHSCSDYNKTDVICPEVCNPDGCACKKNYVYDPQVNKCVLPKDCKVGCGGDPNAVSGCAGYCGDSCKNYFWTDEQKRVRCVHACIPGCKCKDGYLYDDNVKKCVLKEDCSS